MPHRSPRALIALVIAAALVALAACTSSGSGGSDAGASGGDAFPVTVQHAFGSTTITSKPQRVATVAWANHEVPLALGVVPVGMSKASWGDDNGNGVLPWVEEKLTELGAKTPVLFDETDGIDFEAVADTNPDLILAAYSGLSQSDYETLSQIAPTIAFPDVPWGTSMQDMIRLNSTAMGMADEGDALIASLDDQIADTLATYPQLQGKSIIFTYIDPTDTSQIGFYTTHDTRPGFLHDLGLPVPAIVQRESAKTDEFYVTVSAELASEFSDVDIFVTYGKGDGSTLAMLQGDPLLSKIPAIRSGAVAVLEDSTPLAASANPSPLSIGWALDDYFALLAAAADKSP